MTLSEFVDAVLAEDLTDKAIEAKWSKLCDELKSQDVDTIKNLIEDGALSVFVEIEGDDGFGTEGMRL